MPLVLASAILGSALAASCAGSVHPASPIPVEVWRSGDDGLTLKFAEALDTAFEASPIFCKGRGKQPGTVIVTIPSNVAWKQIGKRVRVSYKVAYTDTADRPLGTAAGRCWEDDLSKCATEVVKRAEAAARDLSRVRR